MQQICWWRWIAKSLIFFGSEKKCRNVSTASAFPEWRSPPGDKNGRFFEQDVSWRKILFSVFVAGEKKWWLHDWKKTGGARICCILAKKLKKIIGKMRSLLKIFFGLLVIPSIYFQHVWSTNKQNFITIYYITNLSWKVCTEVYSEDLSKFFT